MLLQIYIQQLNVQKLSLRHGVSPGHCQISNQQFNFKEHVELFKRQTFSHGQASLSVCKLSDKLINYQSAEDGIWNKQAKGFQLGFVSTCLMGLQSSRETPRTYLFFCLGKRCQANSYIPPHPEQVPGPGRYEDRKQSRKKGYSLRPKTAYERLYFIDNKELKLMPSPDQYNILFSDAGKQSVSKYRTVTLGNAGFQNKNQRFKDSSYRTPSPFVYKPNRYGINKYSKGGRIGRCTRFSFIDEASHSSFTPGPGNYRAPTEFAHYKKSKHSVV